MDELKFLVIDDDPDFVSVFVETLKRTSLPIGEVVTRNDHMDVPDLVQQNRFDCVFLDYDLKDQINGLEVMDTILNLEPELPVVMVTARGTEEIAVKAMKDGARDYLVKDRLKPAILEGALHQVLQQQQLRSKIREQQESLMQAERQRVMLESIGATCHHFSQPLTSLMGRLELLLMDKEPLNERHRRLLEDCLEATRRMSTLLTQFQQVDAYRTTPYIGDVSILDIGPNEDADNSSTVDPNLLA